jgi:uncharacterized protein (DUF2164 family)
MKSKWDIANEQFKKQCIDEVLARIDEQGVDNFGLIAAQDIIDIVAQFLGPQAYGMGIEDAKNAIRTKIADLETDLDVLRPFG